MTIMPHAGVQRFIQEFGLFPEGPSSVAVVTTSVRRRAYAISVLERLGHTIIDNAASDLLRAQTSPLEVDTHEKREPLGQDNHTDGERSIVKPDQNIYVVQPLTGTDVLAEFFCTAASKFLPDLKRLGEARAIVVNDIAEGIAERIARSDPCWGRDVFQEDFVNAALRQHPIDMTRPVEVVAHPDGRLTIVVRPLIGTLDWTLSSYCPLERPSMRREMPNEAGALKEPLNSVGLAIAERVETSALGRAKLNTYLRIMHEAYKRRASDHTAQT
jgi:hypothetical protein